MAKKDLLKEAIADAEMLKKVAIENAKKTLNETFEPKIKALLAKKLNEEAAEDDKDEEDMDESLDITADLDEKKDEVPADEEDMDESIDIDAILAEMEGDDDESEDNTDDDMDEAKSDEAEDDTAEEDEDGSVDEEIDLNQLLGELSEKKEDVVPAEDEDETEEAPKKKTDEAASAGLEMTADVLKKLKTILGDKFQSFVQFYKDEISPSSVKPGGKYASNPSVLPSNIKETELQEAKKYAKLTAKINETNLLNAKLLYLNKILKECNLDSKQKVKVINAFDKANNVKETKLVYTSLSEAFKVKTKKTTLKESLGSMASKSAGTSTKTTKTDTGIIDEATYNRWQKLSGLLD